MSDLRYENNKDLVALRKRIDDLNRASYANGSLFDHNKLVLTPVKSVRGHEYIVQITGNNNRNYYLGLGNAKFDVTAFPQSASETLKDLNEMVSDGSLAMILDSAFVLSGFRRKSRNR